MIRSIEQWKNILSPILIKGSFIDAADKILGDLTGYPMHRKYQSEDATQLANAMQAFSQLIMECPNVE